MKKLLTLILALLCLAGLSAAAQPYKTVKDISYLSAPDTLRILAIGNSFSEDAVENNLWNLLDEAGIPAVVANLYIGGCSLERHWNNSVADAAEYRYRKVRGGKMAERYGVRLSEALAEEAWTHVSFQQASGLSGLVSTYEPYLTGLVGYVKGFVPEGTVFAFHQTWAYSCDSDHPEFPVYGKNQDTMYQRIVNAVSSTLAAHPEITLLIPSGTAIQNGRTSSLGDTFNRDGFHLDYHFGRYTAACTWFAALTGLRASDCRWRPESVPEETAVICRKAADLAIDQPCKVTDISTPLAPFSQAQYRKERCTLDICYPATGKPYKTLVWFHGGGLTEGQKYLPEQLLEKGIAVVAVNYRLYPKAQCPAYIQDAAAAVAWVFRNIGRYGGDPSQIYVSGHSAGGYLTLMLALDKAYLAAEGIDADEVRAYYPISGQTATHFTIRKERGISYTTPIVDKMAPLGNIRKLNTRLVLFTGERSKEMMARYEENLYLKSVLEGIGNAPVPIYEFEGANHGTVLTPAFKVILDDM